MARRARLDKSERVLFHIRSSLMTKVRIIAAGMPRYRDPTNPSVPKRGAFSEIANACLQQWVDEQVHFSQEKQDGKDV